ncbi:hypothetical protein A9Q84_21375 [Halobacteriovorax marinus]|uniref:Uncharacterized protein n=1 Tax=Halobacteriovorax marinus TaxID=97084 RepID=A0A1Y5F1Q7_9BACT|nr:hypothetical protein A9Q84_21375 [Halobacteriovorax marinus]
MNKLISIFIILTFLTISNFVNSKIDFPKIEVSKEESTYKFHDSLIKVFSIGQKRVVSDLLWVSTLLMGDEERVFNENSWMFHRFMTISKLEPLFYANYEHGGLYLSIIKDDVVGAKKVYEAGLKYYPNDFWLNYNAAFNDYFELGNIEDALEKYKVCLKSPLAKQHAQYLPSLIARIEASKGGLKEALIVLLNHYNNTANGLLKERLHINVYALKSEIDLKCLNAGAKNCQKQDFDEVDYLYKNGKYLAVKEWVKFRPKNKKKRE